MSTVSIKGVILGGIVDVFTSVVLSLPFAIYATSKVNLSHAESAHASITVTAAIRSNVPLYWGQLLVGLACSVLGGYVAAWLAKHDELLNGGLSSFLCVGLGIYTMASGKDSDAMWVQILMLIASPILALIGGILMRLQRRKSTMHSLQL